MAAKLGIRDYYTRCLGFISFNENDTNSDGKNAEVQELNLIIPRNVNHNTNT